MSCLTKLDTAANGDLLGVLGQVGPLSGEQQ
jgi:hypothetical protein